MTEESSFLIPARALRAAQLAEGMHVADFGAGAGFFTRAAARAVGEHGVVWAVDIQRDLLPRIKNVALAEGLHNVEVVYGNLEHEGGSHLKDASVDLVIISNILFVLEDKRACVAEAARVLRRGGQALVVDWSASFGGLGPHTGHVYKQADAQKLFEKEGFTYRSEVPAGEYHWGFIAKKK